MPVEESLGPKPTSIYMHCTFIFKFTCIEPYRVPMWKAWYEKFFPNYWNDDLIECEPIYNRKRHNQKST